MSYYQNYRKYDYIYEAKIKIPNQECGILQKIDIHLRRYFNNIKLANNKGVYKRRII